MDSISLFLDHYVIYDIKRNSFTLNTNSGSQFEKALRDLITQEIKNTLLKEAKEYNRMIDEVPSYRHERYDRLIDAKNALMDLHDNVMRNGLYEV